MSCTIGKDDPPSSSSVVLSSKINKTKKPPPTTPRRFTRFFTPRDSSPDIPSSSSRALRALTSSSVNSRNLQAEDHFPSPRASKRRRIEYGSSPCPPPAPLKPIRRSKHYERLSTPAIPWTATVSSFETTPKDCHVFSSPPYCSAACNTNSLIAIGDESGGISLLDTAEDFSSTFLHMPRVHTNAIMDLVFSADDSRLASAAGDRLGKVMEMRTQQTLRTLEGGHTATLKQITWHPTDQNMLGTCGRDGIVQLWDLRSQKPVRRLGGKLGTDCPIPSITSINFLAQYSSIVTAAADNPVLQVWDLRSRYSCSRVPTSSAKHGIAHTTLSPSGTELYAIGKNNTVAVYSASHLVLGQNPAQNERRKSTIGAGSMYELTHPDLVVGSFYVRGAVRAARQDRNEVLAVGSSAACAVLFPLQKTPRARRSHEAVSREGVALQGQHTSEVSSVCWSYDGDLVTVGDDGIVNLWRDRMNEN